MVGVLILVHHYVLESVSVFFQHLGELLEKLHCEDEYIVEIHCVCSSHALLIKSVELGDHLLAVVLTCIGAELRGSYHLVLGEAYLAEHCLGSKLLLGDIQLTHDILYHALAVVGIVYSEVPAVAEGFYLAPEYPYAG